MLDCRPSVSRSPVAPRRPPRGPSAPRGCFPWLLPVLAILLGADAQDAAAQDTAPGANLRAAERPEPVRPPLFHVDRTAARQVLLGRRALAAGEPTEAIDFARLALRAEHDSVLPDGVPVRAAAAELLEQVRAAEPRLVELRLGAEADSAYAEAAPRGDVDGLARVAARFPGTNAGRRAAARLADLELDRGRYASAARLFDALHEAATAADTDRNERLLKAAVSHWRAGDPGAATERFGAVSPSARAKFFALLGGAVSLNQRVTRISPLCWVRPAPRAARPATRGRGSGRVSAGSPGGRRRRRARRRPRRSTPSAGRPGRRTSRTCCRGRAPRVPAGRSPRSCGSTGRGGANRCGPPPGRWRWPRPGESGAGGAVVVFATPAGVAAVDAADGRCGGKAGWRRPRTITA